MQRIGFVIGVLFFVAASGLFVVSLHEASAQSCGSGNVVLWRELPTNEVADSMEVFDTQVAPGTVGLLLSWSFQNTPFIGAAEVDTDNTDGIVPDSVTYTPAYFFPSVCIGSVGIHVDGQISESPAILVTKGWVWDSGPVYDDDFHTLLISQ